MTFLQTRGIGVASFFLIVGLLLAGCSSAEQRAEAFYASGIKLAEQKEPVKATLEFRNALKLRSNYPDAWLALGQAEEVQGHYDAAFAAYRSAAEQEAPSVEAHTRLVYLLIAARQPDEALKYADAALLVDPKSSRAMVAKAAVQLKLDNRGEAVKLANAALAIEPTNDDALMVLASEQLLAGDAEGALEYLDRTSDAADRNVGMQFLRLVALESTGDDVAAEGLFRKLLETFPESSAIRQSFVEWYLSKDRSADAEDLLRKFANAHPNDDEAQVTLVAFQQASKGTPAALEELSAIVAARQKQGGNVFKLTLALARLQLSSGDASAAATSLNLLIQRAQSVEERGNARMELAKMKVAAKDSSAALSLIGSVLEEDPKNADALKLRASLALEGGKGADAIQDLIAALNEAPERGELHELLAQAYEQSGSASLAEEEYVKALQLSGNSADTGLAMAQFLLRYGKASQAERVLESVLAKFPDNREVLKLLADLKLASQDWVGAQEIAVKLKQLQGNPDDIDADQIDALALTGLNRYSESIDLLKTSLDSAGDRDAIVATLIDAYVRAGRQNAAEDFLKARIAENPKNARAYVLLASVYMTVNRRDEAKAAFVQASLLDPTASGDAALAQFYVAERDFAAARKSAQEGLKKDPKSIPLRLLLAGVLELMELYEDAIAEYETLFALDPQSTIVANGLASLISERRSDKASLDRAMDIAKRFATSEVPQYLDTLGWIYYLRGEYDLAMRSLQPAAAQLPSIALVQYHLGMTQFQLGQTATALKSLEQATTLEPPLIESDRVKALAAIEKLKSAAQTPTT